MYHYTECGLKNIWLSNGYTERKTAHGAAVAIADMVGLHRAIGLHLVTHKPQLTGAEVRYLRIELDLSQDALARIIGVNETSVRGWENHRTKITKPAERLLRLLYKESVSGDGNVRALIDSIAQLNRDIHSEKINLSHDSHGWNEAA